MRVRTAVALRAGRRRPEEEAPLVLDGPATVATAAAAVEDFDADGGLDVATLARAGSLE